VLKQVRVDNAEINRRLCVEWDVLARYETKYPICCEYMI
jgi:hypothetical protein